MFKLLLASADRFHSFDCWRSKSYLGFSAMGSVGTAFVVKVDPVFHALLGL